MGADATVYDEIDPRITTEFVGYDNLAHQSRITVLTTEKEIVEALTEDEEGTVSLWRKLRFMVLWEDRKATKA